MYSGAVSERSIERYLLRNIRPLLADYEASIQAAQNKAVDYKAKRKAIDTKFSRLKDLYVDGLIDKTMYLKDYAKLQDELRDIIEKSKHQRKIPASLNNIISDEDFLNTYTALPKAQKRELWQTVIQTIHLGERPGRGKPYTDFTVTFY